jgi:hypothetical protein
VRQTALDHDRVSRYTEVKFGEVSGGQYGA